LAATEKAAIRSTFGPAASEDGGTQWSHNDLRRENWRRKEPRRISEQLHRV